MLPDFLDKGSIKIKVYQIKPVIQHTQQFPVMSLAKG